MSGTADDYVLLDGRWRLKTPLKTEPICMSLDGEDVDSLANRFSVEELLKQEHNADVQEGVARMWAEDADVIYWQEYRKLCRRALQATRASQRKSVNGESSVKAIKERHDIVSVIGRYTRLRKAGKEYRGKCPLHGGKTESSLAVSPEKQLYYCFSCGRKGDLVNFVMEMENLDTKAACVFLTGT